MPVEGIFVSSDSYEKFAIYLHPLRVTIFVTVLRKFYEPARWSPVRS
jgi:hypothetical protein